MPKPKPGPLPQPHSPVDVTVSRGAVKFNFATISSASKDAVLISLDFSSKYIPAPVVGAEGNVPALWVLPGENTIDLQARVPPETPTIIRFPTYKGWSIFAVSGGRYTVKLALLREED